jgi:hypothetical protein
LLVRYGIESPDTIKHSAAPEQSSCGKTRHDGTKEEENAYRCESRCLRPDGEVEAGAIGSHLLNISQRLPPEPNSWWKNPYCDQNGAAGIW